MCAILDFGVEMEWMARNPLKGKRMIELLPHREAEKRAQFSHKEIVALLASQELQAERDKTDEKVSLQQQSTGCSCSASIMDSG